MGLRVLIVLTVLGIAAAAVCAEGATYSFSFDSYQSPRGLHSLPGYDYRVCKIRFLAPGHVSDVDVGSRPIDSLPVAEESSVRQQFAAIPTDADDRLDLSRRLIGDLSLTGSPAVAVAGILHIDGGSIIDIWISPYSLDSTTGTLWSINNFELDIDCEVSAYESESGIRSTDGLQLGETGDLLAAAVFPSGSTAALIQSLSEPSPEYIIITSEPLIDAFEPLAEWKRQLGYTAGVVTTSAIYSGYGGIDHQEQIRNYLIDMYSTGTRWVLLGGDETVVPIRYAFHLNRTEPVSLDLQQICDLYYADLDGDWDADGDGLYGEPSNDSPDIVPDLMLGRALVSTPEQTDIFVNKTIEYERNPAMGDADFATRSLTTTADQMRDYSGIGQDSLIAEALPSHLTVDTWSLAESPTGSDESPLAPAAADFISKLSEGFNMTYILTHGASHGFVTRSSGYNNWPKSYVFTRDEAPAGHATIDDLTNYNRFGVVYSIACNNGAFDMGSPPFETEYPCVAEKFLIDSLSGAAAFIGYSRWGWVATSYNLTVDFNDYIYGQDNRLAPANNYSKACNHFYRDLAYGLNVYGDPSLRIWTDAPKPISAVVPSQIDFGTNSFSVAVSHDDLALDSAMVTVVGNGQIMFSGLTDGNGELLVEFDLGSDTSVVLTVSKPGYLPSESALSPAIVLDADDDLDGEPGRPLTFRLGQNYPNPFNSSTTIDFDLPTESDVRIEVFNILGQLIERTEYDQMESGTHELPIECSEWPTGVYFYRLQAAGFNQVKKMILLK